jgi:hypothetical protein
MRVLIVYFNLVMIIALAQNSHAWWSWSPPGEHSTHHKISDAAYGLASGNLTTEFMKNPEWISHTYPIYNDINAHSGNESRNGGDIESLFKSFLDRYNSGDTYAANTYLGYCVHLIADMHVPAHAYNIKHFGLDTGVPDLFEYAARNMTPTVSGQASIQPDLQHVVKPTLLYQESASQTRSTIMSRGFSGYYHVGGRSGVYANWNGDGPKGYYTVELGTVYEPLDFDLFPGSSVSGTALIQYQLNEATRTAGRFLLAVDKLVSFTPTVSQSAKSGVAGTSFSWSGDGFVPMGSATIHTRNPDGSEKTVQTVFVNADAHFEMVYRTQNNLAPGYYTWWAVDDANGKKSNELFFEIVVPAPDPVNGVCGGSNGKTFAVEPVNLCTNGVSSTVAGTGHPWSWSCAGRNGGITVNCNAIIDVTAPTLVVSTLADGSITNNFTLNVSGTVSDVSGVVGLAINNAAVPVNNGNFSYAVMLREGGNSITTIATDTLGNITTDSRTINLDTSAPVLNISVPADNSKTAQALINISGTVSETSVVTVTVNMGAPQNASVLGNTYSASVNLASGFNTISFMATDQAGNTSSTVRTVIYDNTKPSLAITSPSQDITTAENSIIVSGSVSDSITNPIVSIRFNGQTLTKLVTNGTFSQLLTFPLEGTWAVVVNATDEVGNTSTVTRNIIYAIPVNGSCGTSNNATLTSVPSYNLCNNGSASNVNGTGPWGWSCEGINGGITAGCLANAISISTPTVRHDGILISNGRITPDITDALVVLMYVAGLKTLSSIELIHADVAPLGPDGSPVGNSVVDSADVILILRRAIGIGEW